MDIAVSAGCGTADGDAVLAIMKKKIARSGAHSLEIIS
jgi:hypothetical protein